MTHFWPSNNNPYPADSVIDRTSMPSGYLLYWFVAGQLQPFPDSLSCTWSMQTHTLMDPLGWRACCFHMCHGCNIRALVMYRLKWVVLHQMSCLLHRRCVAVCVCECVCVCVFSVDNAARAHQARHLIHLSSLPKQRHSRQASLFDWEAVRGESAGWRVLLVRPERTHVGCVRL